MQSKNQKQKKERFIALFIVILLIFTFLLTLIRIDGLQFSGDEIISLIAAEGVTNTKLPTLPSGIIYSRGIVSSYFLSIPLQLFGGSIIALRLVNVLFGLGTALLIYFVGKKLGGRSVGLLAFLVFSLHYWHLHVSCNIRMYQPFQFFSLLLFYFILMYMESKRWWQLLGIGVSFVFAVFTHEIFFFTIPFLILIFLVCRKNLSLSFSVKSLSILVFMMLAVFIAFNLFLSNFAEVSVGTKDRQITDLFAVAKNSFSQIWYAIKYYLGFFWKDPILKIILVLNLVSFILIPKNDIKLNLLLLFYILPALLFIIVTAKAASKYVYNVFPGMILVSSYLVCAYFLDFNNEVSIKYKRYLKSASFFLFAVLFVYLIYSAVHYVSENNQKTNTFTECYTYAYPHIRTYDTVISDNAAFSHFFLKQADYFYSANEGKYISDQSGKLYDKIVGVPSIASVLEIQQIFDHTKRTWIILTDYKNLKQNDLSNFLYNNTDLVFSGNQCGVYVHRSNNTYLAEKYFREGVSLFKDHMYNDSLTTFKEAVNLNPHKWNYYYYLTKNHIIIGNADDANISFKSMFIALTEMTDGVVVEGLAYNSSIDGVSLGGYILFQPGQTLPILVIIHGLGDDALSLLDTGVRFAKHGFFVIIPDMRGRNSTFRLDLLNYSNMFGSDLDFFVYENGGAPDYGGHEIHDIYDSIKTVENRYSNRVDMNSVNILGYSGGGGNALIAVSRYPDLFDTAIIYFGIVDYGDYYENYASSSIRQDIDVRVGNYSTATSKYAARNALLAVGNAYLTEVFLFLDENETKINMKKIFEYNNLSILKENRVWLFLSKKSDLNRWHHKIMGPEDFRMLQSENLFLKEMQSVSEYKRKNKNGSFVVLGTLVTKDFKVFFGNSDDAVVNLTYTIGSKVTSFRFSPWYVGKNIQGEIRIPLSLWERHLVRFTVTEDKNHYANYEMGEELIIHGVQPDSSYTVNKRLNLYAYLLVFFLFFVVVLVYVKCKKRLIRTVLKVCVSVTLIFLVASRADLSEVVQTLSEVNFLYYVIAFMLTFVGVCISTYKWKTLLGANNINAYFFDLLKYYFIGLFTNILVPGFIGGDIIRSQMLSNQSKNKLGSYSSTIADRVSGAFILLTLASIGGFVFYIKTQKLILITPFVLLLMSFLILFSGYLLFEPTFNLFLKIFPSKPKVLFHSKELMQALYSLKSHKNVLIKSVFIGLFFQLSVVIVTYILGTSIGAGVPLYIFLFVVPVVAIFKMLPISILGIGIQDGLFVFFLGLYGIDSSVAFTLSIIAFSISFAYGLIGGLVYIINSFTRNQGEVVKYIS